MVYLAMPAIARRTLREFRARSCLAWKLAPRGSIPAEALIALPRTEVRG
jgi:hypothetical protein